MSKRTVIAVVSDLHAGSTVALCPERVTLDDGGEHLASKAQRWLWSNWIDFWQRVKEARGRNDGLLLVVNGDLTEGDHHRTTQILSGNPTAQATVVNEDLRIPLALKPTGIAIIRGTEAHVGPSAAFEERIAVGLRKDGWPVYRDEDTGTCSHWHLPMTVNGVRLDFAHHGKYGTRPSTKLNTVAALAFDIFTTHALDGRPHPHLAFRSHMHQHADTHDLYPTRLVQTAAWQLKTAYVHRINTMGKLSDIGGYIVACEGGRYELESVLYRPAAPVAWKVA